jgi:glycosyltransferase involved in cell wall biosynthesis
VRTAKSVLMQGLTNYEYIVKDGGSNDGTVERLRELGVTRITVSPDTGVYDAMNQALELCRGQFVYFLNAGDTFYSPAVLGQVASKLNAHAAIVYGELLLMPMGKVTHSPSQLTRFYLFRKNLNHQAWLAKRGVYQALSGFDPRYRFNADQHFLRRVVLGHRLPTQHIGEVIAQWSYGGYSTRRSNRELVRRERWQMLREFYTAWELCLYGIVSLYFLNRLKSHVWDWLHPDVVGNRQPVGRQR